MNFRKLKLYKMFRDEEGEYVTLLIKGKWFLPLLERIYGLGGYERIGPNPDATEGFGYNVMYVKRAGRKNEFQED